MDTVLPNHRSSILHIPDAFIPPGNNPSWKFPLIVVCHGGGGNAAKAQKGFLLEQYSDPAGFAVLYLNGSLGDGPAGSSDPAHPANVADAFVWNAGDPPHNYCLGSAPDELFVLDVFSTIGVLHPRLDLGRVFGLGISNGAEMWYKLAQGPLRANGSLRAICPIAGERQYAGNWIGCPVLHVAGTLDQRIRWDGAACWLYFIKQPDTVPGFIQGIAALNDCNIGNPAATDGGTAPNTWHQLTYSGGLETTLIYAAGGHCVWGGAPIDPKIMIAEKLGPQLNIPVLKFACDFFKRHL